MAEQASLNVVLTGYRRWQLVRIWRRLGKPGNKEEWIKQVCKQKGVVYTPPIPVERSVD